MAQENDKLLILDKQFDTLPTEVHFCRNCVVSNQRPRTLFNADGICSACQWSFEKDFEVDWASREKQLQALCDRHRRKDGHWDVVVPGSGGKDSAFVAHQLKKKYGMNPLCVTWAPFEYTPIGWQNFQSFINSGYDVISGNPDGQLHQKLARLAFELKGDAWEPFAYGQKAWAFHIAVRFNIPLIFYGENGELEYGGSTKHKNLAFEGPEEWANAYFKGSAVEPLLEVGVKRGVITEQERAKARMLYEAPHPDQIRKLGAEMHWFSYYKKWTPEENYYYAARHCGFATNPDGRSEGTYTKYTSLDDKADGFHWYLSYIKFGMGRASRDAQQDIRRHHITRDEAVALVRRYDGEFPQRYFRWFLEYLDVSEEFFWQVMDRYRAKSNVWKRDGGEWVMPYLP